MSLTSIKKKLRGMKRRVRNLPLWAEKYQKIDLSGGRDYVKIWIDPFFRLYKINEEAIGKKNPPHWFKKLILKELIKIYLSWQEELEKQKEPYYLKIWLGDPEFIDSRLIAGKEDWIDTYNAQLIKNPEPKPFPKEKFNIDHGFFHLFEWTNYLNGYHVYESETESLKELQDIKAKSHSVEEFMIEGKLEKCYFLSQCDMWLGEIPKR